MSTPHQLLEQRLNHFMQRHLPLVASMGLNVKSYTGSQLFVSAPLALNHNDKGTAFGGSLYNLCVSNAIGLAFIKCFEQGLNPDLVVGKAEIEYLKPVKSEQIISRCDSPTDDKWQSFFQRYSDKGKASISLQAVVGVESGPAVVFNGRFALIGESDTTIMSSS